MHKARKKVAPFPIWPIVIVIYATLLPREVSIRIGENFLYADRVALLLALPWILRQLWNGAVKFVLPDWLILIMGIWMIVSISVVHGFERGMISGVSLALDAVTGYYLARITFGSLDSIRRALIVCAPVFFICALTVMAESLSHTLLIRPLFADVFGPIRYRHGTDDVFSVLVVDVRMGLMRGTGPWVHPIMAGMHLATLLGIYAKSGIRGWPRTLAIAAALMAVFSMSSAAFLSLALIIFALTYDKLCEYSPQLNWRLLGLGLLVVYVMLEVAANRSVITLIIAYGTLDPVTGYYRQAIWTYASQSVYAHPWFGIGFGEWTRPAWMVSNSIDAHWLLLAVRYGWIAALAGFGAALSAIWALIKSEAHANKQDAAFYRGLLISLITLTLMAFTVMLQGGTLTWFTILLGSAVASAQKGFVLGRIREPVAGR